MYKELELKRLGKGRRSDWVMGDGTNIILKSYFIKLIHKAATRNKKIVPKVKLIVTTDHKIKGTEKLRKIDTSDSFSVYAHGSTTILLCNKGLHDKLEVEKIPSTLYFKVTI